MLPIMFKSDVLSLLYTQLIFVRKNIKYNNLFHYTNYTRKKSEKKIQTHI